MTLAEAVHAGRDRLAAAGLECADPLLHMKQIVQLALGIDTAKLYVRWNDPLSPEARASIEAVLRRRLSGEPFQYIAGVEGFWDAEFAVGPGALIPRRETELLVETMLAREARPRVRVAELGAGTGNLGISLLRERPRWEWHAFELNAQTLPYLDRNRAALLPPEAGYHRHAGDFFTLAAAHGPFDWIASNPPYVPTPDWPGLSREVRSEPRIALEAGPEGLDVLRRLVAFSASHLMTAGSFISEMDSRQAPAMKACLQEAGFVDVIVLDDAAGLARAVLGRKP